ncbi:MAG: YceI family protein [Hyphomonadaceae bacterium]|nr:YceI family protein [Hyphomonadaceae bacterium]
MRALLIASALAAALAPALAQQTPKAAAPRSASALAPQWRVDATSSSLGFATSIEGAPIRGGFRRWTADIRFDPGNLSGSSIRVVVDTASVSSGDPSRDATLQEADWFDTTRSRQAVFQSTSIRTAGAGNYEATGTLMMKDRATPVTLPFSLAITGANADAQGTLTLDRIRLGLGAHIPVDVAPAAVRLSVRVKAARV